MSSENKQAQESALRQAVKEGRIDRVEAILAAGLADVNARGREGNSPLHLAIKHGHNEVFDWLLQRNGIDLGIGDKLGLSPLMCATKWGRDHAVNALLPCLSPEQINAQDKGGNTALIWAASQDRLHFVQKLVAVEGIALNIRAKDDMTALESAMDNHNPVIVRFLEAVRGVEAAREKIKRSYDQRCARDARDRKIVPIKSPLHIVGATVPHRPTAPTAVVERAEVLNCG